MEAEHDENKDDFVSADVFLKHLSRQQPPGEAAPGNAAYKRASLALLKQHGGIRNKINLWERSGPLQPQRAEAPPPQHRAAAPGAGPRLAPVKEEREPAAPTRSGSLGSSLFSRAAAAVQAVLPSPGTKQSMAARQEAASFPSVQADGRAASFPSILFGTKQPPKQLARAPLPKLRDSLDGSVSSGGQWRLASAPQQPAQALPPAPEQQAEAEDQLANVDAMSDSSSEWHDASEVHQDQVVLRDDDNPSVSSEATTVVPGEEADDDSTADSGAHKVLVPGVPKPEQTDSPPMPKPEQTDSPPMPDDSWPMPRRRAMLASEVFHSAVDMLPLDGSLALAGSGNFSFAQALQTSRPSSPQQQQQAMEGVGESGPDPPAAEAEPAAAAEQAPLVEEAPVAHAAAGLAEELPSTAMEVPLGAGEEAPFGSPTTESQEDSKPEVAPAGSPAVEDQGPGAEEMPSPASSVAGELGTAAECAAAAPCSPSEPAAVLPLFREFSEAELLYRGIIGSPDLEHSSHVQQRQQPQGEEVGQAASLAAASASFQQEGMGEGELAVDGTVKALMFDGATAEPEPASSPGAASSPTASAPVQPPASLVVLEAAQQQEGPAELAARSEAAEGEAAAEATAAAGLASQHGQPPESIAAGSAAGQLSYLSAPELASPYAATEYDGDDVVMDDAVFTPAPSTVKGSKLKLEALALAGLAVARSPLPLSPSKTPPRSAAAERRLFVAPAEEVSEAEAEGPSVKAPEPAGPATLADGEDDAPPAAGALADEQLAAGSGEEAQGPAEQQGPPEEVPAPGGVTEESALTEQALVAGGGSLTQAQEEEEAAGAALEAAGDAAEEAAVEGATEQRQADEESSDQQEGQEAAQAAEAAAGESTAGEEGHAQLLGQAVEEAEEAALEAEAVVEAEEAAVEVEAALEAEEAALEAAGAALEAAGAALHAAEAALQSPTFCRERLYAEDSEAVLEVERGAVGAGAAGIAAAAPAGSTGLGISGLPEASTEHVHQAEESAACLEAALVETGGSAGEPNEEETRAEDMVTGEAVAKLSAASQEESKAELTAGAAKLEMEPEVEAYEAPAETVAEAQPELQRFEAALAAPEDPAVVPAEAAGAEPKAAAELTAKREPAVESFIAAEPLAAPEAQPEVAAAAEPAAPHFEEALLKEALGVAVQAAWEEGAAGAAEEQQGQQGEGLGGLAPPVEAAAVLMAEQQPELLAAECPAQQATDSCPIAVHPEGGDVAQQASCSFAGAGEQGQQGSDAAEAEQRNGQQLGEEEAAAAAAGELHMAAVDKEGEIAAVASLGEGEVSVGGNALGEEEAHATATTAAAVEVRSPAPAEGKGGEFGAAAVTEMLPAVEGQAEELQEEEDVEMMDVDEETEVFEAAPASPAAPVRMAGSPAALQPASPVATSSPQEAKEVEVFEPAPASPAAPASPVTVSSPLAAGEAPEDAPPSPAGSVAQPASFVQDAAQERAATDSLALAAQEVPEAMDFPAASPAAAGTGELGASLTPAPEAEEASVAAPVSPTPSIAAALEPASPAAASTLLYTADAPQNEQQRGLSPVCSPAAASMPASPLAFVNMEDELPAITAEAAAAPAIDIEAIPYEAMSIEVLLPDVGMQSEAEAAAVAEQRERLLVAASVVELPAGAMEQDGFEGAGSNASSPAAAAASQPSSFAAAAGNMAGSPSSPAAHLAMGPLSEAQSPACLAGEAAPASGEVGALLAASSPAVPASPAAEAAAKEAAEEQAGSPASASSPAVPGSPAAEAAAKEAAEEQASSPIRPSSPALHASPAAVPAAEVAAEEEAGIPVSASNSEAAPVAEEAAEEQTGGARSTSSLALPALPATEVPEEEAGSPISMSGNAAPEALAVALGSLADEEVRAEVGEGQESRAAEAATGERQALPSPASPSASCSSGTGEPSAAAMLPLSPAALSSPQRSPAQGAELAPGQGDEQEGADGLPKDVEMMDAEPEQAEGEVATEEAAAAAGAASLEAADEETAGEEGVTEQDDQEPSLPGSPGLHAGKEAARDSPAGQPSAPEQDEGERETPVAGSPGLHAGEEAARDSPAGRPSGSDWQGMAGHMNFNPLAASLSPRYMAASPAITTATGGYSNSNPLYAGTPGHPTPPSVTLKAFPSRLSEGTPLSRDGSSSSPASVGIKLAERLQEVASQLQQPVGEPAPYTATPGLPLRGQQGGMQTPVGPGGSSRFAFASDVAAMLQALDQRTPATAMMPGGGRAAAMATTVQRQPRAPRFSFATTTSAAVFNLDGFDVDGNRNGTVAPTPAHALHAGPEQGPLSPMAEDSTEGAGPSAASQAELEELRQELAALRGKVSELEEQREEAVGMLAGYQGSIAQLQDQHSSIMVKVQAENTLLKAEIEQLKGGKSEVERQFNRLYHEKYVPLKAEAGPLRQEAATLRSQLAAEEAKGRRAELALQALQQELAAAREEVKVMKEEKAAALAAALAAQQAGQKMEQKLKADVQRSTQALTAVEAELADVSGRYSQLAKQYDEAVHKVNLAKQARERAYGEVQRKEEEICNLELRLRELEGVLRQYKAENSKFFDMKERYKTHIAGLEKEVQAKEAEKEQLLKMCNELMTQLEREGLCLDG